MTSLDGIVAVDPEAEGQGGLISGGVPADRFLMGLLRAFADVVLVGAGTLRAEPRHLWTPARVYPPAAEGFAQLRAARGQPAEPPLAVVSASGEVDPELPALRGGMILTTRRGAGRIAGAGSAGVEVKVLGEGLRVPVAAAVDSLRAAGHRAILTEGGPQLFGQLLAAGLVDELFLTLSPVLAGRERGGEQAGLVEGTALLPEIESRATLLDARRSGSHLFLRYGWGAG